MKKLTIEYVAPFVGGLICTGLILWVINLASNFNGF